MSKKRPIPTIKIDNALDNFINDVPEIKKEKPTSPRVKKAIEEAPLQESMEKGLKVNKSLSLDKDVDDALRLEVAKTREPQIDIIQQALTEFLKKRGHIL